jgi:superfamily I DNA/RNA helicase
MTRARVHLIFSVARMRRLWGDVVVRPPSRFLREAGLEAQRAFATVINLGELGDRHEPDRS